MKKAIHENHRVVILPETCGEYGFYRRSLRPGDEGYNETMEERCSEIVIQVRRHVDGLALSSNGQTAPGAVQVKHDTRYECSFCGLEWEEFTQDDFDNDPNLAECSLPGDGPGLPACCSKAQEQWRKTHVPVCGYGPVDEGVYCDEVIGKDDEYCPVHAARIAAEDALTDSQA